MYICIIYIYAYCLFQYHLLKCLSRQWHLYRPELWSCTKWMPPVWWRHWCQAHPGPRSWKIAGWLKVEMTIKKKSWKFQHTIFWEQKTYAWCPMLVFAKLPKCLDFGVLQNLNCQRFQPARSGKLWTISSDRLQLSIPGAQETGDGEFPSCRGRLAIYSAHLPTRELLPKAISFQL